MGGAVDRHEETVSRLAERQGTVVLLGGLDVGKTTIGREVARAAVEAGRTVAFVDADIGQSTVGPPSTVGLKLCREPADLEPDRLARADAVYFVGSTSPQGHLLPLVAGAAVLLRQAHEAGAQLIVLDTSAMVSGVYGQMLKFHKLELARPDVVLGLERGEELSPIFDIVQRFFAAEIVSLPVHGNVVARSAEQRAADREEAMRRYFAEPLQRWRVQPTVFMPAVPALFDLRDLSGMVVGLSDGKGAYLGVGSLEVDEESVIRLLSPAAEAPKALRLGSLRLVDGYRLRRVDLRSLFGSD